MAWRQMKQALVSVALLVTLATPVVPVMAGERINKTNDSIAIEGYDTVAYFTKREAMPGDPSISYIWQDSEWHFATAGHKDLFIDDPEKFAPRYGGYCSGGMAIGVYARVDPEAWVIIDDNLYLNYAKGYVEEFVEHSDTRIADADANWEKLGRQ